VNLPDLRATGGTSRRVHRSPPRKPPMTNPRSAQWSSSLASVPLCRSSCSRAKITDRRAKASLEKITGVSFNIDRPGSAFKQIRHKEELYAVCSLATPETAGGWGTFERLCVPTPPADAKEKMIVPVSCIHVATRKRVGKAQRGPEMLKVGHIVYDVLFLEPTAKGTFKRIGRGVIFDKNIMKDFDLTEAEEFQLE